MKKVKGMPITGTNTQTSQKKPFVPDAKETSADEQRMIQEAPAPFKNKLTAAQAPAGSAVRGAVPGSVQKPYAGLRGNTVGAKALPPGGPVGQRRPINQSGQIGGRKGFPPPARKAGPQNLGKSRKHASFYGE